ncbi:MAG: hypothetical protein II208_03485 [Alphaproteobacteria bacterium]|nr:hypothetical protein [Alphaproteobacteria bacterium]
MDVREYVYSIIKSKTGLNYFSDKSNLRNDLGLDSLDQLELTMQIEDKYKLPETTCERIAKIETVGDLINVIEATDTKPIISTATFYATQKPALYTVKNGIPYCKITEKPCTALRTRAGIINPVACNANRCKIVKNIDKMLKEIEKIK